MQHSADRSNVDASPSLRNHLLALLKGGHAHVEFDKATADLPPKFRGARAANQPHTPWRLIEHIRIAQWDILEFCRNAAHVSPDWPGGYWPEGDAPPNAHAWEKSLKSFRDDRAAFAALIAQPDADLLRPLRGGHGQTLAREAMLIVDHTAYHLGQLILLRRVLGAWKD
jgi:hypothetical protein